MKHKRCKKAFNITSLNARLFKGAIYEGLRLLRVMVKDNVRTPKDYRLRAIWEEVTKVAENTPDNGLKQNILNVRDVVFPILDDDPPYNKAALQIVRGIIKRRDEVILSTGYTPVARRILATKKKLQKKYGNVEAEPKII